MDDYDLSLSHIRTYCYTLTHIDMMESAAIQTVSSSLCLEFAWGESQFPCIEYIDSLTLDVCS